ncbi:unnamed protein product [Rangifer tarandus platyrhynchus]|uniref:Uncharacterized protein n=2 Tax=Rangifer tarandus platyrhynchus TaxID=3082113 RepID=A0ABN8Y7X0_RANTA|nr:unnamed protein product [Rangifer tarandus platyrhynchus]
MAHPQASSAFPYCHRLPLLAAETAASLGSKRPSLPSWPSPCSHHPVTSGTRGPRWPRSPPKALGSGPPPPGLFRPVSGCGHIRETGQHQPRRESVTLNIIPRNSRKRLAACLPPAYRPVSLFPYLPWPSNPAVHPYTLQPPLLRDS